MRHVRCAAELLLGGGDGLRIAELRQVLAVLAQYLRRASTARAGGHAIQVAGFGQRPCCGTASAKPLF
jgi:hypothetical protein